MFVSRKHALTGGGYAARTEAYERVRRTG